MRTLGGFICIRKGDALDFCWRESVRSMLPVCDVVSISITTGDHETEQQVRQWASIEPKISVNVYDWTEPVGNPWWYNDWLNYARMHTPAELVLQLDADEVLCETSYKEVQQFKHRDGKFSVICTRLNFWSDHRHLIPAGHCCGKEVIRIAPQGMFLSSDGYDPRGTEVPQISVPSGITIFHYGFIRRPAAFFEKERFLQRAYFNSYDPRLEQAEKHSGNWGTMPGVTGWENNLDAYDGKHPIVARQWLNERGYDTR